MAHKRVRGAAVVMAMLIVAITATLVAGVFWRQNVLVRQTENESSYAQAKWLMRGAVDWAGVILREDARTSSVDHLDEPWAVPLADTRLNEDDDREPVYLAGQIRDAQAKFNLRNLIGPQGVRAEELAALRRLLAILGLEESLAEPIAERVRAGVSEALGGSASAPGVLAAEDLLGAEGLGQAAVERLRAFVIVLPEPTPLNANTAPPEVLAARIENLSLADARQLVASRQRAYFKDRADVLNRLPQMQLKAKDDEISVSTRFFAVEGAVSYRRARLRADALLRRDANRVETLWLRESA